MNESISLDSESLAKRHFRNFLLDARFQLKYAGLIIGSAVVVSVVLGWFLWNTSKSMLAEAEVAVAARSKAAETSRDIGAATLNNELMRRFDDSFQAALREQSKNLDATYEREKQASLAQHAELVRRHGVMSTSIVGGLLALVALIALFSIVATHRIVGPVFRMKKMMQEVGAGKAFESSHLRKRDEFQDLREAFMGMIQSLYERQNQSAAQLNAIVQRVEQAGGRELAKDLKEVELKLRGQLQVK